MRSAMRRLWSRQGVVDAVTAVALALLIGYALVDPPGPASPWPAWSAWPVGAVLACPVAVRRRWPLPVLAVAVAAAVPACLLGGTAAHHPAGVRRRLRADRHAGTRPGAG